MSTVFYLRISTKDQTTESQRQALGIPEDTSPDNIFTDEGVSGTVDALDRPGFAACARYLRKGDTLKVYALDRLGRNAIDVQRTFDALIGKGVVVDVHGMGVVAGDAGKLLVTILSGVAELERKRIADRTQAGREAAVRLLNEGKPTQNGKTSLGRARGRVASKEDGKGQKVPRTVDPAQVVAWRTAQAASIQATADHFGIGSATVKRYLKQATV